MRSIHRASFLRQQPRSQSSGLDTNIGDGFDLEESCRGSAGRHQQARASRGRRRSMTAQCVVDIEPDMQGIGAARDRWRPVADHRIGAGRHVDADPAAIIDAGHVERSAVLVRVRRMVARTPAPVRSMPTKLRRDQT